MPVILISLPPVTFKWMACSGPEWPPWLTASHTGAVQSIFEPAPACRLLDRASSEHSGKYNIKPSTQSSPSTLLSAIGVWA